MVRGHSNANAGETKPHPLRSDVAMVPIAGGARIETVRDLPTLALQKDEWKTIGRRMGWRDGVDEAERDILRNTLRTLMLETERRAGAPKRFIAEARAALGE